MLSKSTSGDYLYFHLDSARESDVIPGGFGGQSPPHQSSRLVKVSSKRVKRVAFQPTRSSNSKPNSQIIEYCIKVLGVEPIRS